MSKPKVNHSYGLAAPYSRNGVMEGVFLRLAATERTEKGYQSGMRGFC